LKLRIPGWANNEAFPGGLYKFKEKNDEPVILKINGELSDIVLADGYAVISRKWREGDKVEFDIPMPVRKVVADDRIKEDRGKIAVQKGPLIYCAEWPDNKDGNILNLMIKEETSCTSVFSDSILGGTQVINLEGYQTMRSLSGNAEILKEEQVTLIPYAFWNNRGPGQMMVWLPASLQTTRPLPAATFAFRSKVRASIMNKGLAAVNDQIEPLSSNDPAVLQYDWWPEKNKWEWIEYNFEMPHLISKTKVYWYDNSPDGECRIPDEWEVLYLNGNIWEPVRSRTPYKVVKDGWNSLSFEPVTTSSVKIKVRLDEDYSGGIYEWVVE
jgi:hypothetical protein